MQKYCYWHTHINVWMDFILPSELLLFLHFKPNNVYLFILPAENIVWLQPCFKVYCTILYQPFFWKGICYCFMYAMYAYLLLFVGFIFIHPKWI